MSTPTPDSLTQPLYDALQAMDVRLNAQDFESVLLVGNDLMDRLVVSKPPAPVVQVQCLRKMAEALIGLRNFEEALEKLEDARILAEANADVCAAVCMDLLFVMERALNAISMLEKLGTAEAELKSALVSQYLMQTKNGSEQVGEAIVDQELLDSLYNSALKNLEDKNQSDETSPNAVSSLIQNILKNEAVQAVFNQSLIWISLALFVVGAVKGVQYATTVKFESAEDSSLSKLRRTYNAKTTSHGNEVELLSFKSSDGFDTLALKRGDIASYSSINTKFNGRFVLYDGSPIASVRTIFYSNLGPSCIFQCRGASIVSQMGAIFFNRQDSGYRLVEEMNHAAGKLAAYVASKKSLPARDSPLLSYLNPETKKVDRIIVQSVLDLELNYKPGAIILVAADGAAADFHIHACDREGELLPVERRATNWQSLVPAIDPPKVSNNQEVLFVFCERPFSSAVDAVRKNLWFMLVAVSAISGILIVGLKMLVGTSGAKLRVRKSRVEDGDNRSIRKPK